MINPSEDLSSVKVSVYIPASMLDNARKYSAKEDRPLSSVIRMALARFLFVEDTSKPQGRPRKESK